MGSDMLLSGMVAPHFVENIDLDLITKVAVQVGIDRIHGLIFEVIDDDRLQYLSDVAETEIEDVSTIDPGSREIAADQIKQKAIEAVRALVQDSGPDDIAVMTMHGQSYWITGGMSWGDTPTDSFLLVTLLDALDIYDDPITADEVLAAKEFLNQQ